MPTAGSSPKTSASWATVRWSISAPDLLRVGVLGQAAVLAELDEGDVGRIEAEALDEGAEPALLPDGQAGVDEDGVAAARR